MTKIQVNELAIRRAIDRALAVGADFLLTPDANLSGYFPDFNRVALADAVQRFARHTKESRVGLLLSLESAHDVFRW